MNALSQISPKENEGFIIRIALAQQQPLFIRCNPQVSCGVKVAASFVG